MLTDQLASEFHRTARIEGPKKRSVPMSRTAFEIIRCRGANIGNCCRRIAYTLRCRRLCLFRIQECFPELQCRNTLTNCQYRLPLPARHDKQNFLIR